MPVTEVKGLSVSEDAALDDRSLILAARGGACALVRTGAGRCRDAAAAAGQQQADEPEREYEMTTCPHFKTLPVRY